MECGMSAGFGYGIYSVEGYNRLEISRISRRIRRKLAETFCGRDIASLQKLIPQFLNRRQPYA
jgi:hypothetical protein